MRRIMPNQRAIPKRVRRKHLFKAATFDLFEQILDFGPGRRRIAWYMITHPGASSVLPILDDGRIVMLRQYRPAIRKWMWEVPCGTLGKGEGPLDCAARELAEEAGYSGRLSPLPVFYSAPGFCDERMYCYIADRLEPAPLNRDLDERIVVHRMRPERVRRLLETGKIEDAKTLICLLSYFLGNPDAASPGRDGRAAGGPFSLPSPGAGAPAGRTGAQGAPRRRRGPGRPRRRRAGP